MQTVGLMIHRQDPVNSCRAFASNRLRATRSLSLRPSRTLTCLAGHRDLKQSASAPSPDHSLNPSPHFSPAPPPPPPPPSPETFPSPPPPPPPPSPISYWPAAAGSAPQTLQSAPAGSGAPAEAPASVSSTPLMLWSTALYMSRSAAAMHLS